MFALIKFAFFTFVAIAVGVVIGTVPVGGRTIADRLVRLYDEAAPKAGQLIDGLKAEPAPSQPDAKGAARASATAGRGNPAARTPQAAPTELEPKAEAGRAAATGPVTAGASNRPDSFSTADRDEVEKIIAARRGRK